MIVGVGIDVVGLERFAATLERTARLRERLFAASERHQPIPSLAGRFAAKEAIAKALGAPRGLRWVDAVVITDRDGRPSFELTGSVAACAEHLGVRGVHLSISHDGGVATAIVVLED